MGKPTGLSSPSVSRVLSMIDIWRLQALLGIGLYRDLFHHYIHVEHLLSCYR